MIDKRKYPRRRLEYQVQIRKIDTTEINVVRNSFSSDISEIGAGIISFDFYPVNKKVYIRVMSNGLIDLLDIVGKVVWVREIPFQNKYRIGVSFEDVSENVHLKVRNLMDAGEEN